MGANAPNRNFFRYTKTHAHVTFIIDDKHKDIQEVGVESKKIIGTQGT